MPPSLLHSSLAVQKSPFLARVRNTSRYRSPRYFPAKYFSNLQCQVKIKWVSHPLKYLFLISDCISSYLGHLLTFLSTKWQNSANKRKQSEKVFFQGTHTQEKDLRVRVDKEGLVINGSVPLCLHEVQHSIVSKRPPFYVNNHLIGEITENITQGQQSYEMQ